MKTGNENGPATFGAYVLIIGVIFVVAASIVQMPPREKLVQEVATFDTRVITCPLSEKHNAVVRVAVPLSKKLTAEDATLLEDKVCGSLVNNGTVMFSIKIEPAK